jgi:hypothetical protein
LPGIAHARADPTPIDACLQLAFRQQDPWLLAPPTSSGLSSHITDQVKAKLLDLFRWRRGTFHLQPGISPPGGGLPLGIDPFELIVEGVSYGYPNHEVLDMCPAWEGRTISPTQSYGPGFFALPLPPSWSRVLEAAGTPGTMRDILDRSQAPDAAEAMRALFLGLEAGLLQLG